MTNEFIEELNMLLAGEISAVETYEIAMKAAQHEDAKAALITCQNSHSERVDRLTDCVMDLGGTPATSAGVWGPLAAFSQERQATELDTIAHLEQSEAERLVQYEAQQHNVVSPVWDILTKVLLPAQHETHLTMSSLLKSMLPIERPDAA
jgi:hypothetical protein